MIFAYFVALAPNHLIQIKSNFTLTFLTYPALLFILYPVFLILPTDFSFTSFSSLTYLVLEYNVFIYILLALTLFLALIAVVKISIISSGPLRPYS